ncbi:MAG TPA: outer membrane protein transport protein [Sphingomonas sp.]|nr:outer membrane protein transport protein [Sphingomonas sp.]
MNKAILRKGALLAFAGSSALVMATQANAAAFYLQEQSVKAEGRAFSGEVSERGAQQMWWNPASIGGIDTIQNYFGLSAILPHGDSTNVNSTVSRPGIPLGALTGLPLPNIGASTTPVGGVQNRHNPIHNGYVPNGGIGIPLGDKLAVGFTITSPYSFTTKYDADSWARYGADKSRLRTLDFQPVVAFSPTKSISIGAGPNIEYIRATLSNYLPDPLPAIPLFNPVQNDGHQYLKGTAWDVGYSVGVQYHNHLVDLGVSYKSKITHKVKGHLIVDGITDPLLVAQGANQRIDNAHAEFTTPWQLIFGGRVHVTPQLTVNGQVSRFGWNKFDAIRLSNLGPNPDQAVPENYRNTWSYAAGFDYLVSQKWTVRGGVQRDLTPIIDGFRDARVPDGNRWNFAAGTSYALTSHFTMDAAANYLKIKSERISATSVAYFGTPVQTIIHEDGLLHNAHAVILSVGGSVTF